MRPLLEGKGARKEISRAQRRVRRDKRSRDAAMRRACLEYDYTMESVAQDAGIHESTVSKGLKEER